MAKEYIEKDTAVGLIGNLLSNIEPSFDHGVARSGEAIKSMKAADVREDTKGTWEYRVVLNEDGKMDLLSRRWFCSACGEWETYGPSDFCPNCGARMTNCEEMRWKPQEGGNGDGK